MQNICRGEIFWFRRTTWYVCGKITELVKLWFKNHLVFHFLQWTISFSLESLQFVNLGYIYFATTYKDIVFARERDVSYRKRSMSDNMNNLYRC